MQRHLQQAWAVYYSIGALMLLPSLVAWARQASISSSDWLLLLSDPQDALLAAPVALHCLALAGGGLQAGLGVSERLAGSTELHQRALYCAGLYMFAAALRGRAVAAHGVQCGVACVMLAGRWAAAGWRRVLLLSSMMAGAGVWGAEGGEHEKTS
jgi:hypothetical protein